ncbi:nuclear mRNA export, poly(A)+RNA binding protein [Lecanora helva]
MLQTEPKGPRAGRSSARIPPSRGPNRGGIHKQTSTRPRTDKDGDLVMGGAPSTRGANNTGRHGRNSRRGNAENHNPRGKVLDPQALQQALIQSMASNAPGRGPRNNIKSGHKGGHAHNTREPLDEISIIGLKDSMAAKNAGGGSSELIAWLEHKASRGAPEGEVVKVKKSRLEGAALIISVRPQDTPKITKLNDYTFAKAKLSIELRSKAKALESPQSTGETAKETEDTIQILKDLLFRRYNTEMKLLDLSALGRDKALIDAGMFNTTSRESKFFPALMKVCDDNFTDVKSKEEAIVSVSLADNALTSISSITTLAQTLPLLKNLDLSNNQIKTLGALDGWRWKFRKLNHLVLSGNPIETEVPSYHKDILKWYPALTMINNNCVRSPEEVEAAVKGKMPIPVLPASFRDENNIAENFVKLFFPAYDTDRSSLVNTFYDANSTFSLSVNTRAPRALDQVGQHIPSWDAYLRRSRNLTRISHLPAKLNRLYSGTDIIRDAFTTLPPTQHPHLTKDPQKWSIECHTIPGLVDLTGQSPSGVGGMIVYVHGEFTELDGYTNQRTTATRSFDRTFVLGPGGPSGIRVQSDMLTLRAYGGFDAWQPEGGVAGLPPINPLYQVHIETPAGWAMPGFGKSEEQVLKERMILEMSQSTGLTLEASHECLEMQSWSPEGAMNAFLAAKADLPRNFFIATR